MPVGFDANSYTVSFWGKRLTTNPCSGDYLVEYRPVESLGGPTIGDGLGLVAGGGSRCVDENVDEPEYAWGYNAAGRQAIYRDTSPDNDWHLYTGIVREEGVLDLYVDGVLEASLETPKEVLDTTGPLQIGSFYYGCDCAFDDFRIYDRALVQPEIDALFAEAGSTSYIFTEAFDTDTADLVETLATYDRLVTLRPDPVRVVNQQLDIIPTGIRGGNLAYGINIERPFSGDLSLDLDIGGEGDLPGQFMVGIAVGNNVLLFHPGLEGGQFRHEIFVDTAFPGVFLEPERGN